MGLGFYQLPSIMKVVDITVNLLGFYQESKDISLMESEQRENEVRNEYSNIREYQWANIRSENLLFVPPLL